MSDETSKKATVKWDKRTTNVFQRLAFIQGLFKQYNSERNSLSSTAASSTSNSNSNSNVNESADSDSKEELNAGAGAGDGDGDGNEDSEFVEPFTGDSVLNVSCPAEGGAKPNSVGSYRISSSAHFSLTSDMYVQRDRSYYEIELLDECKDMFVGYATDRHSARAIVGQDGDSYGYNGYTGKTLHCDSNYGTGQRWREGDVLGLSLDTNARVIECSLNGESLGVLFPDFEIIGDAMYVALTLQPEQSCTFVTERSKLQYMPDGFSHISVGSCSSSHGKGVVAAVDTVLQFLDNYVDTTGDTDMKDNETPPETQSESSKLFTIDGGIAMKDIAGLGIQLTGVAGFATAVLSGVPLLLQCESGSGSNNGKYYFELILNSGGCMQLGFCDSAFKPNARRGEGCGDDDHSWAVDLLRNRRWGSWSSKFQSEMQWKTGDIIGCELDLVTNEIRYNLNGNDLGIAFTNVAFADSRKGFSPAVSFRDEAKMGTLIEYYTRERQIAMIKQMGAEAGEAEAAAASLLTNEFTLPSVKDYINIALNATNWRLKLRESAQNYVSIMDDLQLCMKDICNGLEAYSYEQYISDYHYMDKVIHVSTREEFDALLNQELPVIVDWFATWCRPCVGIAPEVERLAEVYKQRAVFVKVDVDQLKDLSKESRIEAMPTFHVYINGEKVDEMRGASVTKLVAMIEKHV
jgi:thioredoxin 1